MRNVDTSINITNEDNSHKASEMYVTPITQVVVTEKPQMESYDNNMSVQNDRRHESQQFLKPTTNKEVLKKTK